MRDDTARPITIFVCLVILFWICTSCYIAYQASQVSNTPPYAEDMAQDIETVYER